MNNHRVIKIETERDYLPGLTFQQFQARLAEQHAFLLGMIDQSDPYRIADYVDQMNRLSWEFEGVGDGGRGAAYNLAQRNTSNRSQGMTQILKLFSDDRRSLPGRETLILDALAGDGTVTRFAKSLPKAPTIISADLSALMIEACLAQGLPCLRQTASHSLLKDDVLDGVLIAWGSHHLTAGQRREAALEAKRTLRRGGRFVLHDFEIGGAVDAWFGKVVHPFSATGHPHPHFSREEMQTLLSEAGFDKIEIFLMADPFLIEGENQETARRGMLNHLYNMYGLSKLSLRTDSDFEDLEAKVRETAGEIEYLPAPDGIVAKLHRDALVAVGVA